MKNWIIVAVVGLGTYALRLSFIGVLGARPMPIWAQRPLRFVAPAVLAALVVPAVVLSDGVLDLAPSTNPRLAAALVAAVLARYLRNVAGVIVAGMSVLWLLQALA